MNLAPPPADWQEAILVGARQFMNGRICFFEETDAVTPYDPITGEGGATGIRVIWAGKARIQQLRTPKEFSTGYELEASRFFRFQLDPEEVGNPIPFVPHGTLARALDGGRDSSLESLSFTVNSSINSSHMAVRTVELASNMIPIAWTWKVNEDGDVEYA